VTRDTAGGAEQILSLIDDAIVAAGHHSIVIACDGSAVRGDLIATPRQRGALDANARAAAWRRLRELVAKVIGDVDVVHYHGFDFAAYDVQSATPRIATLHLAPSLYPQSVFAEADPQLVCVSESQRRSTPRCNAVITNGIDLDLFRPGDRHDDYVLALGRICEEKGFHDAINAAKLAGVRLVIAGEVFAYREHQQYFSDMIVPRLGAACEFLGPVPLRERRELIAGARCIVVPSRAAETSSLVTMEALASGTPVIAYPSGALPEIVGRGGVIVNDVVGMANAIRSIDAFDRNLCGVEEDRRCERPAITRPYPDEYARLAER